MSDTADSVTTHLIRKGGCLQEMVAYLLAYIQRLTENVTNRISQKWSVKGDGHLQ